MEAVLEASKPDIVLILGGMTLLTPNDMFDLQWDLLAIFNPILTFSQSDTGITDLGFCQKWINSVMACCHIQHWPQWIKLCKHYSFDWGLCQNAKDSLAPLVSILNIYWSYDSYS